MCAPGLVCWSFCLLVQYPVSTASESLCLQYYFNPAGQRFRSRQEIMRHLELAARQSKKISREEAVANAKATAEQLGKQLPISLDNGVTVVRYAPHSPCGHQQSQSRWHKRYAALSPALLCLSFYNCIQKCVGCMLHHVCKLCGHMLAESHAGCSRSKLMHVAQQQARHSITSIKVSEGVAQGHYCLTQQHANAFRMP